MVISTNINTYLIELDESYVITPCLDFYQLMPSYKKLLLSYGMHEFLLDRRTLLIQSIKEVFNDFAN